MTTLPEAIEALGLSIRAEFIPFSRSRSAGNKDKSLNWKVTLVRRDRDILTTDYSAGIGHCPAYKTGSRRFPIKADLQRAIAIEVETGKQAKPGIGRTPYSSRVDIKPNTADVIHSLVMDADVIDFRNFEEWANEFGFDPDSRKAEATYRACLEIALTLRSGLGEADLATLREAASEY